MKQRLRTATRRRFAAITTVGTLLTAGLVAAAPMVVKANPGDVRGLGYYLWADQRWTGSPAGTPMEEQLHPYWAEDLASGRWTPIDWGQKPNYVLALGVIRHGNVFALTQAEHAALRGADLSSVSVQTPPTSRRATPSPLGSGGISLGSASDNAILHGHAIRSWKR